MTKAIKKIALDASSWLELLSLTCIVFVIQFSIMERKKAIILLLVLQLTICCDGQTSQCLCKGDTCYVSADDIFFLGEMIHSNQLIILTSVEISVDESSGFIVIENVSNLTISGGESGSLIECFENSFFGLHFKNTTNVILTRLRIKNVVHSFQSTFCSTPVTSTTQMLMIIILQASSSL